MSIVRQYQMSPIEGQSEELVSALVELASKVRVLPGCEQVIVLSALDGPVTTFIEQWTSIEAHKSAGAMLGAGAFDPVMTLLAEKPKSAYLQVAQAAVGAAGA